MIGYGLGRDSAHDSHLLRLAVLVVASGVCRRRIGIVRVKRGASLLTLS